MTDNELIRILTEVTERTKKSSYINEATRDIIKSLKNELNSEEIEQNLDRLLLVAVEADYSQTIIDLLQLGIEHFGSNGKYLSVPPHNIPKEVLPEEYPVEEARELWGE